MRRLAPLAFVAVLALAGCGSSKSSSGAYVEPAGEPVASVTVDSGNFFFKPDDITVPSGVVSFTMKNTQSGIHTFVIRGVGWFMLEVSGSGDSDTKKVELKPGTYTFYCNIPGHEQAGMKGKLTVTG